MKLFIGNLSTEVTEEELTQAAEAFGTVEETSLGLDNKGNPKGFGFVTFATAAEGKAMLEGFNGKEMKGQTVKISESRPEVNRSGKGRSKGWNGLGGRNAMSNNKKGNAKTSSGGKGYGGTFVGGSEG